jgi:hypothetical protein
MAYIRDISKDKCSRCRAKVAVKEVIDRQNGSVGKFCTTCAKMKLNELKRHEHGHLTLPPR